MGLFRSKKIQSLLIFIIAVVAILWIFQKNLMNIFVFSQPPPNEEVVESQNTDIPYLEKIDNFIIKEYSNNQVLLHTIEADVYKSFKNAPVQLETVKVTTFDELQNKNLTLKSDRAVIFKSGAIHFIDQVEIKTMSGISHEIDTELLIVKDGQINSNRRIVYLGETAKIIAEGMDMDLDRDIMNLNGEVQILQDTGAIIDTKDLLINQEGGVKKYVSKEPTVYRSNQNIVNADKGIDVDMNSKLTKLLGNVDILDGSGSSLKSYDLIIDQSNGGEIFMSDSPSRFKSSTVDIKSKKMHYDAISKKLKLMDEVVAVYE
ncbi:LPS export ABC transporter periplasmic protein LptC [Pseudothioglobus sp. nBUS_23]|uniref:LPS export ABC transporter periplasmic protein LptC n=1 Tax=Pseudothioglobus sp. nBUS_23 TaxID=3395318 RepID=UPI003EB82922